jgi:GNAT superfamily N-acetyltransferase
MDDKGEAALTADGVGLRLLGPVDDIATLTALLHRAYAPLAARGLRYLASHQDNATTRRRISGGECWLAEAAGRLIGTITLRDAHRTNGCPWYDRPDVASFGQFAVDPLWQGRGVGSRLVDRVERRARENGVAELALDTAETADDLIAFYTRRGYRFVDHVRWDAVNYRSVVLSKRLG